MFEGLEPGPGPELVLSPLPLRVSQAPPGSGLARARFPGPGFAGSGPTGTQHTVVQSAGVQNKGVQNTGTEPEDPGGAGASSGG